MNDSASQPSTPLSLTKRSNKVSWIWRYTRLVVIGLLCWLFVRSFIFQGAYIPSNSMEGTLYEGDFVFVNKLAYGPRVPMTWLTIPFTEKWVDWIQSPYYRLPGFDSVQINDVIVFNLPSDTGLPIDCRQLYIKRCVALPGDSFEIDRGIIFVNGKEIADPGNTMYMYTVAMKQFHGDSRGAENPDSVFKHLGIRGKFSSSDRVHYIMKMTWQQADSLEKSGYAVSVVQSVLDADRYDYKMFPQNTSKAYRWNLDNFGPLIVPAKGMTIALNVNNIHLYKDAIELHEGNILENHNDSIYINGLFAPSYTFKLNYYFVMGDNRYDSNDSRYWGFVPESHVVGRAVIK